MNTTYYKLLFVLLLFFTSCNKTVNTISDRNDYDQYLEMAENKTLQIIKEDYKFWKKKLEKEPNQFPYLSKIAASQSQLFGANGDIDFLIEAEKNLLQLNERTKNNKSGHLRALARNYISQHRFKESLKFLKIAEINGENLKTTQKMLFDVYLELGNSKQAEHYLSLIKDFSDFDFLIRLSKWSDHQGDLKSAIKYMESGVEIAESSKNKGLMQWAYTNLADFYGHDGQIEKSYTHFLKALKINPDDAYAKKGIAWIVYSHERKPKEALRILNAITQKYNAPDYYLLKAEIAEYMVNYEAKKGYIKKYLAAVSNQNYGDMYNAYNAKLYADELQQADQAIELANSEIENRPTPLSYDLLAWSYYNKGNYEKALIIAEEFIVDKTSEPEAIYHLAKIYKANGEIDKAKSLKKELKESVFELGPGLELEINQI